MEYHWPGLLAHRAIFCITHHTHDLVPAARRWAVIAEALPNRVFAAEEPPRGGLIDQRNQWSIFPILLPEFATPQDRGYPTVAKNPGLTRLSDTLKSCVCCPRRSIQIV